LRDNIFQNIITVENSFTELLCNILKYNQFRNILLKFIGISDYENYDYDTQYKTKYSQKNGRPDFVIYSNDTCYFLENKISDTPLTRNQPKGYLKELSTMNIKNKCLYFLLPRNYKYKNELDRRIEKYNINNIETKILYWENLFEELKDGGFLNENDVCREYYNLIKERFGYEPIKFCKGDNDKMKKVEIGKYINKIEHVIYNIEGLIGTNGFKTKSSKMEGEIGFTVSNDKEELGWFGTWFELWAKKGDAIIFIVTAEKFNNLKTKKFHIWDYDYFYISFDSKILDDNFNENNFIREFTKFLN
jgi:hypothetical protein